METNGQRILVLDYETRSLKDIRECGSWAYHKHHSTQTLLMGAKWIGSDEIFFIGSEEPILEEIRNHKGPIVAHNYVFEYAHSVFTLGLPWHINQFICTQALCYRHRIPAKLNDAANVLKLKNRKLKDEGARLIQKYSLPQKDGTFREITPEDFEAWKEYNKSDILATEELYLLLSKKNSFEDKVFEVDQKIQDRGMLIDLDSTRRLIKVYERAVVIAERRAYELAGYTETKAGNSTTLVLKNHVQFRKWLRSKGLDLHDVSAATIEKLDENKFSPDIKSALRYRKILTAAAVKKLYKLIETSVEITTDPGHKSVGETGFYMQYHGAHTGRWAGRGFQPHNLPNKSVYDEKEFFQTLEDLEAGRCKLSEVIEKINSCIRPLLTPRSGLNNPAGKFDVGDLGQIEARLAFYIARCARGLKEFETQDIYVLLARDVFNNPTLTKENDPGGQRNVGKTGILQLQFGSGAQKFADQANVSLDLSKTVVFMYREKYPEIPQAWKECEKHFKSAMHSGRSEWKGHVFEYKSNCLRIQLLSGRHIYFWNPHLKPGKYDNVDIWIRELGAQKAQKIWGGIIFQNIVQSTARDVIAEAIIKTEESGLAPVLSVHDEIICDNDDPEGAEKLMKILTTAPDWCSDLFLKAEVFSCKRYVKR